MKHYDTITGLALLVLCAIAYWLTTGFSEVPALLSQNVPPTFFPRLVLSIVATLSVVLVAAGISQEPEKTGRPSATFWRTVVIIASTGILASILGTLLTLGIVAVALPIAWGERRYSFIGILAVCLPISIYLIFTLGLNVHFPAGQIVGLLLEN